MNAQILGKRRDSGFERPWRAEAVCLVAAIAMKKQEYQKAAYVLDGALSKLELPKENLIMRKYLAARNALTTACPNPWKD